MKRSGASVQAIHSLDWVRSPKRRRRHFLFHHVVNPNAGILWISPKQLYMIQHGVFKGFEYAERYGLPPGMSQEQFDMKNESYQSQKTQCG